MARHRSFGSEFKLQIAKEFLDGRAGLHELARRHSLSRNLIRLWIRKYEAGEFTDELAERGVVGANRPNFANPLCARFPYVRPHAIGGVPIRASERSCAGLSLFFRRQRVPNPASHLAASEQCVLRTAGTPKSRPEKENRDEHRN